MERGKVSEDRKFLVDPASFISGIEEDVSEAGVNGIDDTESLGSVRVGFEGERSFE